MGSQGEPLERNQPGFILFRGDPTGKNPPPVLIVFLVPETATSGLDKQALAEALDWSKGLDVRNRTDPTKGAATSYSFSILGPTFSGSQVSA